MEQEEGKEGEEERICSIGKWRNDQPVAITTTHVHFMAQYNPSWNQLGAISGMSWTLMCARKPRRAALKAVNSLFSHTYDNWSLAIVAVQVANNNAAGESTVLCPLGPQRAILWWQLWCTGQINMSYYWNVSVALQELSLEQCCTLPCWYAHFP